jgi:hypothetical protein
MLLNMHERRRHSYHPFESLVVDLLHSDCCVSLDKVEIFRDKVLAVIYDKHAADVELDIVVLLLGLEEVERCTREFIRQRNHSKSQ